MKIAAAWLAILGAGIAVGGIVERSHRREMIGGLVDDAKRAAIAFDTVQMGRLGGTTADLRTPVYGAVKQRLRRVQLVHERVRYVYLLRYSPASGGVILLADSTVDGAPDATAPGDDFPRAKTLPGLQEVLRTGVPGTDGPVSENGVTWVTAYALVGDETPPLGMEVKKEIIGIDVVAEYWDRELWQSAFQGAFYVWALLGLPFIALLVRHRQDEQREVIRNLSAAMEQSHSGILIVDLESRIEYANRGLCQQIGYSRRELIGRPWREFQVAQSSEDELAELITTVRTGHRWDGEWFNQRKDGSVYPVRGVVTPVKHRDGSLACFVAVFDDVSETKRKEDELREARDLAQAGDRAKGQFLATMSHEVRTPLNGIVGFTSLLIDTGLSLEQREYVQTIRMSTEALIQLTGDILDFARIESGKLKLEPLACDPVECVEDAMDLLAAKGAEKKIEVLHRVEDDVPSAVVTDGGRLRQVLVNLIGNAIKFTDRGEVEVSIAVTRDKPEARRTEARGPVAAGAGAPETCTLTFAVRDTGIGIAREHLPRLFKPFSQVDESSTRRYGGTGLGLAISRNLVHLLGGEIGAVSTPGEGSIFTFTIRAPMAVPLAPVRDLAGLRTGLCLPPGGLRRELARLLRHWNAEPVEVDSAAGLQAAAWDVAIMEVTEDDARELVGRRDATPELPPAKMLGLVPINLPNELRTALRGRFRLLLNKPVHHSALFSLLAGSRSDSPFPPSLPTHFGFRVLIVEDNVVNQRLMQRVLTTLGCTWSVVENGRRAMGELTTNAEKYDVILLDLHMPEMDGLTALQEIRAGQAGLRAQNMWIIALTADAREDQRTRALTAGLNDYLTKPVKLMEIEAAFRRFRQERSARRG